ncbi:MAG: lipo-like protein, partial [Dokdonella sp.]
VTSYAQQHTRICRPVGLDAEEIDRVARYALDRVGNRYDLRNIVDLARYLIRTPPVPNSMRRQMLALGSGDPTRAICSSLIAEAFASVRYPVLPDIEVVRRRGRDGRCHAREILHIRHSSLYMPRDFDVSPYFQIIKPTLASGFDPHQVAWAAADAQNLPHCD